MITLGANQPKHTESKESKANTPGNSQWPTAGLYGVVIKLVATGKEIMKNESQPRVTLYTEWI